MGCLTVSARSREAAEILTRWLRHTIILHTPISREMGVGHNCTIFSMSYRYGLLSIAGLIMRSLMVYFESDTAPVSQSRCMPASLGTAQYIAAPDWQFACSPPHQFFRPPQSPPLSIPCETIPLYRARPHPRRTAVADVRSLASTSPHKESVNPGILDLGGWGHAES
ncbi:hypothetical protein CC78DRAFT_578687 [Lojkania enalia]|uniref:Uncharacterized protein n=1 Tax=Lojkania enalia TaxID=147567 RepID=A0A9P4KBA5_9PLEO|nr:hypothetical protein CC78DRAFT_578687 [Didymosphaeria enalia]